MGMRVERTLFTLDRLQNPELRRRVQVGLAKGEANNSLVRVVCFNRLGELRDRMLRISHFRADLDRLLPLTSGVGVMIGGAGSVVFLVVSAAGQGAAKAGAGLVDTAKQKLQEGGIDLSNIQGQMDQLLRQTAYRTGGQQYAANLKQDELAPKLEQDYGRLCDPYSVEWSTGRAAALATYTRAAETVW
jgi:Tn3 transposase DDE domain